MKSFLSHNLLLGTGFLLEGYIVRENILVYELQFIIKEFIIAFFKFIFTKISEN